MVEFFMPLIFLPSRRGTLCSRLLHFEESYAEGASSVEAGILLEGRHPPHILRSFYEFFMCRFC
jgi:hypothetical protein